MPRPVEVVYENSDGEVVTEEYEGIDFRDDGFVRLLVEEEETDDTTMATYHYVPRERIYRIERIADLSTMGGMSTW